MGLRRRLEKLRQKVARSGGPPSGRDQLGWALKLSDEEAERLFPGLIAQSDPELEEWERLPQGCRVYPFNPKVTLLGCVDPRTGVAAVTVVHGIDLDVMIGKKPGPPRITVSARTEGDP
jgi:hypothetical protein